MRMVDTWVMNNIYMVLVIMNWTTCRIGSRNISIG